MIFIPISYSYLGKKTFLSIFIPLAFLIVITDYLRRNFTKLNDIFIKMFAKIMRQKELLATNLTGLSYTFIAVVVIFLVAKSQIAIMAFLILAISDSLAAIIGKSIKSRKFYQKTVAGSLAFFLSALAIVTGCAFYFGHANNLTYYICTFIAIVFTTAVEARPEIFEIDDNFLIPFSFAFITSFLDYMWQFL
jgi:dolichol kinase